MGRCDCRSALSSVLPASRPRGSVLVFAVVLLVLLFGIGTAFILFVRQASQTSSNLEKADQSRFAAESGLAHALRVIRQAVATYRVFSPDAAFDPGRVFDAALGEKVKPYYRNENDQLGLISTGTDGTLETMATGDDFAVDADADGQNDYILPGDNHTFESTLATTDRILSLGNVYRTFEVFDSFDTTSKKAMVADQPFDNYALLFWREEQPYAGITNLANPLRFTDSPLTVSTNYNGSLVQNYIVSVAGDTYTHAPKHFGLAFGYGVGDVDLVDPSAPSPLPTAYVTPSPIDDFFDPALMNNVKRRARVERMRGEYYVWVEDLGAKLYVVPSDWGVDITGIDARYPKTASQILTDSVKSLGMLTDGTGETDKLIGFAAGTTFANMGQVAAAMYMTGGKLDSTAATPQDFLTARYTLDRNFTLFKDEPLATGKPLKWIMPNAIALNINTAPFEVIAAALSQIPLKYHDPMKAVPPPVPPEPVEHRPDANLANALAARICVKRPFICQIDFEDFLAAHLPGNPGSPADLSDEATPVGMIYMGIDKRESLPVSQHLGLAGPVELTSPDDLNNHPLYRTCNKPGFMKKRFEFFRQDDTGAPIANAILSQFAFNNILNSVSGKRRAEYSDPFAYSYYSYVAVGHHTFEISGVKPKIQYNELLTSNLTGGPKGYSIAGTGAAGELMAWRATNATGHYEMVFSATDDKQKVQYLESVTDPLSDIVIEGNSGLETPVNSMGSGDDVGGTNINAGPDGKCDTFVHGPMRAYRHTLDNLEAEPTAKRNSGASANGDVSWSPRFAFRSRFFKIYVMGRSYQGTYFDEDLTRDVDVWGPIRRIEVTYDALKDEILSRREQLTEMRSLSDPDP